MLRTFVPQSLLQPRQLFFQPGPFLLPTAVAIVTPSICLGNSTTTLLRSKSGSDLRRQFLFGGRGPGFAGFQRFLQLFEASGGGEAPTRIGGKNTNLNEQAHTQTKGKIFATKLCRAEPFKDKREASSPPPARIIIVGNTHVDAAYR